MKQSYYTTCGRYFLLAFFCISISVCGCRQTDNSATQNTDWIEYNGDGARSHYSSLSQINAGNLSKLKVTWEYASGGVDTVRNRSQMQCNPIVIDGVLYGVNAATQPFAVNAATGAELWKASLPDVSATTSRGLTYYEDTVGSRLFFGGGKWIYALDPGTGKLIVSFGDSGRIDLSVGIKRPGSDEYVSSNTPNTIYQNLLITGARLAETETAMLGDIRAYEVHTGKLVWTFKTIPEKGDPGSETWPADSRTEIGGANPWAGMAIDRERGIVYAPTGSAAFDFYGGNRKGANLYANSLLALEAATGKLLWHYQFVHHDIWDRDPPCPPNLLTIQRDGKKIDVVVQVTKQGTVFVFDRVNGKPIFPIEEKIFPQDAISGEFPFATQPVPVKPLPFTRQSFTEKDFNTWVSNRDSLVDILKKARTGMPYIPVTEKMTIFFPGTDGGAQWGGAAADEDGILYIPAKEIPCYTTLQPAISADADYSPGEKVYIEHCSSCHGADKKGSHDGTYPALIDIEKRMNAQQAFNIIQKGKGRMASFAHLTVEQLVVVRDYLLKKNQKEVMVKAKASRNTVPYRHTGYNRWYSNGYPVNEPPWGTLTAVDINTGDRKWQVPLGEYPELTKKGIPATGTDNYGGPLVTASGLIVIAATRDEKIRVFSKENGQLLWEVQLPAAGYASPSTYSIKGKQFIVIACGGGKLNTRSGDRYVAFSLGD
jgi:quinoprotein glucose dehydrogenase